MALLRRPDQDEIAREAIVLDLGDLVRQGRAIEEAARERAAAIIADGEAERRRLIADAAASGHAEGLAAGLEEGRTRGFEEGVSAALESERAALRELEEAWLAAVETFEAERDRMLAAARRDVVRLAIAIAEKVTKRVVETDPDAVRPQIEAVLALLSRPTRLVIAVHPGDQERAGAALPALTRRFACAEHVEVVPDESLDRGSCVAVCDGRGEIDASIATQLERIADALVPSAPGVLGTVAPAAERSDAA